MKTKYKVEFYFFLFLSLNSLGIFGQAFDKKECMKLDKLIQEASNLETNKRYDKALNKLYSAQVAARGCSQQKVKDVKQSISNLFNKIQKLKDDAEKAELQAKIQKQKAQNNASLANNERQKSTARYWTSDADHINPIQGLRLLENAKVLTKDSSIVNDVRLQVETIFNESNKHQFQEKYQFDDIESAFFSPDGQWLVTKNIKSLYSKMFNINTAMVPEYLKDQLIDSISFSSNSKWIIVEKKGEVHIHEICTGNELSVLKNEKKLIDGIFSNNGNMLITTDENHQNKVWDIENSKLLFELNNAKSISNISFSPDDNWLILTLENGYKKIIDTKNNTPDFIKNEPSFEEVTFSPDGKWLFTSDSLIVQKFWDIKKGKYLGDFLTNEFDIHFYPKFLLSISGESVKVWDISSQKCPNFLKNETPFQVATISNDGKKIITYNSENPTNGIKYWDLSTEKQLSSVNLKIDANKLEDFLFSDDNKWGITKYHVGKYEKILYNIWDANSCKTPEFLANEKDISYYKFSKNNSFLFIKSSNGHGKLYDLDTQKPVDFLKDEKNIVDYLDSGDGQMVLTKNSKNKMKIWNPTNNLISPFLVEDKSVLIDSISNDWLFIKSNFIPRVANISTAKIPDFLKEDQNLISIEITNDSKWLICKYNTDETKIVSTSNFKSPYFLKNENINAAQFSIDNNLLITIDSTMYKIWDLNTGARPDFIPAENNINTASFSPQSPHLFTFDEDSTLTVWDLTNNTSLYKLKIKGEYEFGDLFYNSNQVFSPNGKYIDTSIEIMEVNTGQKLDFIKGKGYYIDKVNFLNDNLVAMKNTNKKYTIWNIEKRSPYTFLDNEENIAKLTLSPNNKLLFESIDGPNETRNRRGLGPALRNTIGKMWDIENGILKYTTNFEAAQNPSIKFTNNSQWVIKNNNSKINVLDANTGKIPQFFKNDTIFDRTLFSNNSRWLITKASGTKVWNLEEKEEKNFQFKNRDIQMTKFSDDSKYLVTVENHKVVTYNVETTEKIQTLWLNKNPSSIVIDKNKELYVSAGNAIIKMNILNQRGNFFSYGDGETLEYSFDEIEEWKKDMGNQILLPLNDDIKLKYGIRD